MKLLYLWVEEYHIFHHREFTFCGEYQFHYDEKRNLLSGRKNDRYPSKFYNSKNVQAISYIVGDNGMGKTTLLNLLMQILPFTREVFLFKNEIPIRCIYVLEDDSEDGIYIYTTLDRIELNLQEQVKIRNNKRTYIDNIRRWKLEFLLLNEIRNISVVFHSNIFDRNRYNLQNNFSAVEDISFNGLLKQDFDYRRTDLENGFKSQLRIYLDADMMRQIKFITENNGDGYRTWIPFSLPQCLYLFFTDEDRLLSVIYKYDSSALLAERANRIYQYKEAIAPEEMNQYNLDELREISAHLCSDILRQYQQLVSHQQGRFQNQLNKGILMSCIRRVYPETVGPGTSKEFVRLISNFRKFMRESNCETSLAFVQRFLEIVYKDSGRVWEATNRLNEMASSGIQDDQRSFYISVRDHEEFLEEFYRNYCVTAFGADYLTFQWEGLSSGEYNLMSLFSRLYALRQGEKFQNSQDVMVLLDEADLSYHPHWQQKYIDSLVKFFDQCYSDKKIQIIVATHSPIMLSDALKENVIFLYQIEKELKENTFGANIYDLYREGMFLDKCSFGIIGIYAKNKIQKIINRLEYWEDNIKHIQQEELAEMEEMKKLVDCIGEPVIRGIIKRRIDIVEEKIRRDRKEDSNQTEDSVLAMIEELKKLNPEQLEQVIEGIKKK